MALRTVTHIEIGADDWAPSVKELTQIAKDLKRASQSKDGGVVFTRPGVFVRTYEIDENAVFVVDGKVINLDEDDDHESESESDGQDIAAN